MRIQPVPTRGGVPRYGPAVERRAGKVASTHHSPRGRPPPRGRRTPPAGGGRAADTGRQCRATDGDHPARLRMSRVDLLRRPADPLFLRGPPLGRGASPSCEWPVPRSSSGRRPTSGVWGRDVIPRQASHRWRGPAPGPTATNPPPCQVGSHRDEVGERQVGQQGPVGHEGAQVLQVGLGQIGALPRHLVDGATPAG